MKSVQSAREVLAILAEENPGNRWAITGNEDCIGVWSNSLNRYSCVAASTIVEDMPWVVNPGEYFVNGQPHDYRWVPTEVAQ